MACTQVVAGLAHDKVRHLSLVVFVALHVAHRVGDAESSRDHANHEVREAQSQEVDDSEENPGTAKKVLGHPEYAIVDSVEVSVIQRFIDPLFLSVFSQARPPAKSDQEPNQ